MLELKDVTYSYQSKSEAILSKVSYRFEKGKFYSIIGQSGAGKSTLLSLLAGLDYPKKGQVLFNGENIKKKAPVITVDTMLRLFFKITISLIILHL